MKKKSDKTGKHEAGKKITRKVAIKKTGLLAVSAAAMMMLISNPVQAETGSIVPPPIWNT